MSYTYWNWLGAVQHDPYYDTERYGRGKKQPPKIAELNVGSKVIRNSDGKVFVVAKIDRVASIKSQDGETDTIKWYGTDMEPIAKGNLAILLYVGESTNTYKSTGEM